MPTSQADLLRTFPFPTAALYPVCSDDALRETQPNALVDDIDPEFMKLVADGDM